MKFDTIELFLVLITGTFIGVLMGTITQDIIIIQPIKVEAIEKGFAEWKIVNNKTGETKFKMK